jgi:hypothetical protein
MKNTIALTICFLLINYVGAQITGAEYFFDTDPGVGNGTSLSASGNIIDEDLNIPTTGLSEGIHKLFVRTLNSDGSWSLYDQQVFFINPNQNNIATISNAEYFFDTDPGVGNGTSLSVSGNIVNEDLNIPTTGLSEGIHKLYIRTQNSDGSWSLYDQQVFYVNPYQTNTALITSAEYFFDTDPGVGNGTSLSVSGNTIDESLNIPTAGLSEGIHKLYVRTQKSDGSWSIYDQQVFYVNPYQTNTALITSAEYFFDVDPGIGNGTSIELNDAAILDEDLDISVPNDLPNGDHFLYLRLQNTDGTWSLYGVGENFTLSQSSFIAEDFKLYPNPVEDKLHLDTTFGTLEKIMIIDTNGKIIREYNPGSNTLDMGRLSSGTYLIYIETETGKISKKVIKK